MEIELAAYLGVRAAGVRDVVAVEGHHVGQHVSGVVVIWKWVKTLRASQRNAKRCLRDQMNHE